MQSGCGRNPRSADMSAERGRAAVLDDRHPLELAEAEMPGIGSPPGGAMTVKDVCDLQARAAHGAPATLRLAVSLRSAARAGRASW
jgi:hypothetical protein